MTAARDGMGPLSPQTIKEYESCPPELKAEVLALIRVRRRAENAKVNLAYLGPILGFIVVLSFLGVSAWLINNGHNTAGSLLGVVDIVSLASVFVLGNPQGIPRMARKHKDSSSHISSGEQVTQSAST